MKERPILFSGAMVRAILAGQKTQTRRVAKFVPRQEGANLAFTGLVAGYYSSLPASGWVLRSRGAGSCWNDRTKPLHCPYGVPGDRLWVRESAWYDREVIPELGAMRCFFEGDHVRFADGRVGRSPFASNEEMLNLCESIKKRPAILMPRWASRITLEVTGVRVERLHDISEADAQAEGIAYDKRWEGYGVEDGRFFHAADPRRSYEQLWCHINGEASWGANPWVWVVEFRRTA